ncbi:MAG: lamin tail domain-containing protein [Verrucomicrobia bacterium]|nr:lamin tail domain-containing protein [Verrucomicrobiota bacterium]
MNAHSVGAQGNGVYREVYTGIGGVSVADLLNAPTFPNSPTAASVVMDFFEAPTDVDDNYGQRMRALITAPTTGNYVFWIASDDGSALYLSSDATPANKKQIASVASWTSSREWTKEPNQKSMAIPLIAGQQYYIEALQKEGGGGDNLAVRWQLPSGTIETPIPASRLQPYGLSAPIISAQPANATAVELTWALFTIQIGNPFGISYQWQRNGANIIGATNSQLYLPFLTLADSGATFRCLVTNPLGSAISTTATLTVVRDTTPPALISAANSGENNLVAALFSEPVEAASATKPNNYAINNGIVVQSARLSADLRTVMLTTTPMATGGTYTLTVSNVRDRASIPNTMAANSQRSFTLNFTPLPIDRVLGKSEKLGPSSRRTGLVISEIMYHPPPRADGKNVELVELYNSQGFFEDISGYRLTGAIDFTFPPNTTIPASGFIVVAPSPADIQSVYGISGVFGGFTNSLQNSSGVVRLRNNLGAVLLEANYSGTPPYPAAADGAGHSLVLARPSYGEKNAEAWATSDVFGGTPGAVELTSSNPYRTVVINEFLAHTDDPIFDFIELFNYSSQPVDLSGCFLSDDAVTNKFAIPNGTVIVPKGFVVFDQNQIGFSLNAAGETIYFKSAANDRVIDAVRFAGQQNGVSVGRFPDGAPDFHALKSPTPGAANDKLLIRDVVINEIMYDPISHDSDDEFVELYNRGTASVNLANWRLSQAISFKFPAGTILAPNSYLVVARNAARLLTNYPNLNTGNMLGDFKGGFSAKGDRLALTMPDDVVSTNSLGIFVTNVIHIVVDEVDFRAGGRWSQWPAGGGSSLELIDARSDHRRASNWTDSDESSKSAWTNVEFTGVLDNGNGAADSLQIFLQGAGECLVDNVEVFAASGANLIANSTFESDLTGWFPQGTHDGSFLETNGGYGGSTRSLHLVAGGRGDTGANRVRTALTTSLNSGQTATLRAKVRWLKGNPEILLRLHGNWLEAPATIIAAKNFGTPGAKNSRAVANAGPAISEVTHNPVLPAQNQAVTVSARVHDPDGVAAVVLTYRVDPSTNTTSLLMANNGAGYFSGTIPGQAAGALVAFWISAEDNFSPSATASFPNDAPRRECLVRSGETQPSGSFGTYRLWITQATIDRWSKREKNSNQPLDATFCYGNQRAVYNLGALYSGSPWHTPGYNSPVGNMCDYVFVFPDDDLFLGTTDFVIASVGNLGSDDAAQREQTAFWMLGQLGVQNNYRRFIKLFVNGQQRGSVFEDSQQPSADMVKEWFPNDNNGDLHKIEDWFEFDTTGDNKLFNVDATLQKFTTTGGTKKLARYRWNWRKRAVNDSANAYTNLFQLVDAVNSSGGAFVTQTEALMNVEEWMRVFCVEHLVGNWDSYGYSRGKNMYAYKPENGPWQLLAWDIDFVLGSSSNAADSDMFGGVNDPMVTKLLNNPRFRRAYFRAMEDAVNGPLVSTTVGPLLDAKYAALKANGIGVSDPSAIKSFIAQRRSYLQAVLSSNASPFTITSGAGANFSVNNNFLSLTGKAPISVKTIEVNGVSYPASWTTVSNWTLNVPLNAGANALSVKGYNLRGDLVTGATGNITVTYTGASERPEDFLVINEIMYNPLAPNAGFIEILNTSPDFAFDLSNYRLDGADFTFNEGTVIAPGSFAVVVSDPVVFAATYGSGIPIAGVFKGKLDNGGETLSLIKPGATPAQDLVVDEVRYDSLPPWPAAADGAGPSLQLIDPQQDNSRVANWTTGGVVNTPPPAPQWTFVSTTGTASSSTLYIYLQSAGDVYLDDLTLVAGGTPNVGPNLLASGSFDSDLTGWTVSANLSPTVVSTSVKHAGAGSLHLVATSGGTTRASAVWQDISPALVSGDTYTLSYWYLPSTNGTDLTIRLSGSGINSTHPIAPPSSGGGGGTTSSAKATPGAANSVLTTLPAFPSLWINEVQPENATGATDHLSEHDPWIEIFNSGAIAINLSGFHLANNYTNLTQWAFPANTTISAGQYLRVWADGQPAQATAAELHTNFRLNSSTGSVALVFTLNNQPAVLDYLAYSYVGADRSFGSYPNGQSIHRQAFHFPTPAAVNNPASAPVPVVINEWMASNSSTLADPADGNFDDWFELYNTSASTVNLGGYFLTDNLTNKTQWAIPAGTLIGPQSHLLVWADNQPGQNGFNADLHANFQLSKSGEAIGLFALDGTLIDSVTFDAQTNDVSEGRFPDGANVRYFMAVPTPRAANTMPNANHPPTLTAVADQTITEGSLLALNIAASDPDAGQTLTFSLDPVAPAGATINPNTGLFTWTPTETQGPNLFSITIRVADNGVPSLSATRTFRVVVTEVNSPPVLGLIANQSISTGSLLTFQVSATDADVPANLLTFSLDAGAPAGAGIHPTTGVFTWAPTDAQGPSTYLLNIRATDDGVPARSDVRQVQIAVSKAVSNRPPVLATITGKLVFEGGKLNFLATATDPDVPAQPLTFSLDAGAPAGATINPASGLFVWTPTEAQGPGTNAITVRVTDNGNPPMSDTRVFNVIIFEINSPPVLAPIADQTVVVGSLLSFTASATDADIPAQTLTFSLDAGAPTGAAIDAKSGTFTWTPTDAQSPATNTLTIRVSDDGAGKLNDAKSFKVFVPNQRSN